MKATAMIIAVVATLGAGAAACTRANATSDTTPAMSATEVLAARLDSVAKARKFAFGHHDDTAYGHDWKYESGRSDVLETAGDYPAIMSWDLGMLEMGDSANLDGVPFELIRRETLAQHARGGANTFSWHPRNPVTGGDSWDCSDSTTVAKVLADTALSAKYDAWCASLADFFTSLTDSTGAAVPVIFRPWHEMTGSWFWWGGKLCTPDEYRQLWTRMRKVFDDRGVDNVLWAYSPDRVTTLDEYMLRYPGDDMVDIMGVDIYHFNGTDGIDDYRHWLESALGAALKASAAHGKLLALTETGCESLTVPAWWTEVLLPVVRQFPVSYVVVWRNAHDKPSHFYTPYPGFDGTDDFKAFRDDEATLFVSDFKKY